MQITYNETASLDADEFCKKFLASPVDTRYVLGRNEYARSVSEQIEVAGFIDDFTSDKDFLGKPIIRTGEVPENCLVISSSMVRPLSAREALRGKEISNLDYFSFLKHADLDLQPIEFWSNFESDYEVNKASYERIEEMLTDEESKETFRKLINFRLSGDLSNMEGFCERQKDQYFENFLSLKRAGESFYDVGCFDGYTSLEFIKRCPDYTAISIFEPHPKNMSVVRDRLKNRANISFFEFGLSDHRARVRISSQGSSSTISSTGDVDIIIDCLDNVEAEKATFIKMDIEGEESAAITGATKTIEAHHPRLAICVYHHGDDIRKIPEQILSIRDDYDLYLRHYTEGVTETVMFFMPVDYR